ncbi:MAG TPA: putative sugar nucleotidyl transferase [Longimicrobiales bacterium]|nr:putative sugar nucleotidyl transferase [Longimicrobiales bacterium]
MAELALVLFDDRRARDWMPFALTRPVGELRFGAFTLRERAERCLGAKCLGHLTSEHLAGFDEPDAAPVLRLEDLAHDRALLYLSSRAVLDFDARPAVDRAGPLVSVDGEVAGWLQRAGDAPPPPTFIVDPAAQGAGAPAPPADRLPGRLLRNVWELVTRTPQQVARDIAWLFPTASAAGPPGAHVLGEDRLVLGRGAAVEPGVVLDLRDGPIWLDEGATVRAFTRLIGPAYIGRNTVVLGGCAVGVSVGPMCRVHGELEGSVVLGYSNKAHDGFLGHSYVASWVNLGAMTTNSDLKNNYGSIHLWTPTGERDTGELKLGALLGDHVKTGIGTLINTGTVVGAGSNLFGALLPPKYVPPFSWGSGEDLSAYDLDKFLETAAIVMARRDVELSASHAGMLRRAYAVGRSE